MNFFIKYKFENISILYLLANISIIIYKLYNINVNVWLIAIIR